MRIRGQRRARRQRRHSEAGQSTVEFAIILPMLLLVLLGLLQGALVIRDSLALANAARIGARAASVDPRASAVQESLHRSGIEIPEQAIRLSPEAQTGSIGTIQISRPLTKVPIVGVALNSVVLSERMSFFVEGP